MGFAGHMIDPPGRVPVRFPATLEVPVKNNIRSTILRYEPIVAVSSAACGGDIIFAEEIISLEIPLFIILPFEDREEFIERSIAHAGEIWIERFHKVCISAKEILYVRPGGFISDADFRENQHAIIFFALGYSKAAEIPIINIALYDKTRQPNGQGGTLSFVKLCKGLKLPHEVIDLAKIRKNIAGEL